MLSQGVTELVQELERKYIFQALLKPTFDLGDELLGLRLSLQPQIEVDQLQVEFVQLETDSFFVVLRHLGAR